MLLRGDKGKGYGGLRLWTGVWDIWEERLVDWKHFTHIPGNDVG